MSQEGIRPLLLHYCHWYVDHKGQIAYEEVRPGDFGARLPRWDDCSLAFINVFYLAGGHDPSGNNFNGWGNTNSLARNGQAIKQEKTDLRVGDGVIYYDNSGNFTPYNTEHIAMLVDSDQGDPLTMSHGQSSEPAFVRVSQDGRPHRYFRYAVNER